MKRDRKDMEFIKECETVKGNKYRISGRLDGIVDYVDNYNSGKAIVEIKKRESNFYYSKSEYCQLATYRYITGITKLIHVQNLGEQYRIQIYNMKNKDYWQSKYGNDLEEIIDDIYSKIGE